MVSKVVLGKQQNGYNWAFIIFLYVVKSELLSAEDMKLQPNLLQKIFLYLKFTLFKNLKVLMERLDLESN